MSFHENIDRKKLQNTLLIVIAALTVAFLALLLVAIIMSVNPSGLSGTDLELKSITLGQSDISTGTLILADEEHPYSVDSSMLDLIGCQDFRSQKLVEAGLDPNESANKDYIPYKGMSLSKVAMEAAHNMLTDAKAAVGGKAITVDGAFGYVVNGDATTEEYNTAMLMLLSDYNSEAGAYVALSNAYSKWFDANAAKYGFIESFDDAYRYVGEAHAKYMSDGQLTLEQYIDYLKGNTSYDKVLNIKLDDGTEYTVYYVTAKAGDTIKVPTESEGDYTLSGTNEGGVIVTLKNAK